MKKSILSLILLGMTALNVHAQEPKQTSFNEITNQFKDPDKDYRSAPLWVWNTKVDHEHITYELTELKNKGFGGVFVHPRPGLITPYLSDDWFEQYKFTVAEGKRLGMNVWIYDENSYPSGFAGGHVPAEMPSSYNQGQMLNLEVSDKLPDDPNIFLVYQLDEQGNFLPIKDRKAKNDGKFYLFRKVNYGKSPWYGGYSYVDLMVKGVTEKFIEITMSGYEKHFGNEFGKTVPGIFTDEPNIEVQGSNNIRWTPDLFSSFQEKWGYALEDHLPSLYFEKGDWKRVRHNYYETLLQLFIDRWSKPWFAYTEAKGLEWTGHYWEHGWPNPNHGGDNMAMYAWHQRPAIDMLFNQFDEDSPNAQFGNIRAVKELASVANQIGAKRTLSETYGGAGWELTFKEMKRLGDWEYVLGVNTLNQHLSYMTIVGARKYDYPPSFSYHSPWWSYYKNLNDYFGRLSYTLSLGEQVNDICILEPTSTTWMYSKFEGDNKSRDSIGRTFQTFVRQLENLQVEYDLASENIIKDRVQVMGNHFQIGKRKYSTFIIPEGSENLNKPTVDALNKFIDQGGKLINLTRVRYMDGQLNETALAKINQHFQEPKSFQPKVLFNSSQIAQTDSKPISLYHHRRKIGQNELIFLTNSSTEETIKLNVPVLFKHIYKMDLFSGETQKLARTEQKALDLSLEPVESAMYFFSNEEYPASPFKELYAGKSEKVLTAKTSVKYDAPNVLTVDFCDLQIDDKKYSQKYLYEANDILFKHFGFQSGNPWNTSVQYKDETIKRNNFPKGPKLQVDYYVDIQDLDAVKNLKIGLERDSLWEIWINDKPLKKKNEGWFIDKDIKTFVVSSGLKQGSNKISIKRNGMNIYAEIEPIYLLGNFAVQPTEKGWAIHQAMIPQIGSWKSLGRPLYGHSSSYTKKLNLDPNKNYRLKLKDWKGTAAILKVNGKIVQDMSYPPFEASLQNLRKGENTVEVIIVGSLKNTLGPFHNNPRPGMVSPWHFRNVSGLKAGKDYQIYDYGLLEDFELTELQN